MVLRYQRFSFEYLSSGGGEDKFEVAILSACLAICICLVKTWVAGDVGDASSVASHN